MAAMRNPGNGFLKLNRFSLENGTLDFGTTIGCVNTNTHEVFIAVLTNLNLVKPAEPIFLYSTILMRALLFSQLSRECLIMSQYVLCRPAFMPELRNMRPARGVCSYKYPNSCNKVVSSGPNI